MDYQTILFSCRLVAESVLSETVRFLCLMPGLMESFSNSFRTIAMSDTYDSTLPLITNERLRNMPRWRLRQKTPISTSDPLVDDHS